jgi:simple sugar transport system substrate-binding protein
LWAEVQDLKQQILGGSVVVENIADADGVHARMSSVDVAGDDAAAATGGSEVLKIAVAAPEEGNDFGWNQQGVDGAIAAAAAFGIEIEVADGLGYDDVRPVLRELADDGADLIIAHASGFNTAGPEIAAEFGVPVAIVDNPGATVAGLVADYTTSPHEGAYLAGFLAAKSSRLGKLGIVVSGEPPSWNSQSAGFADGARSADPGVELLYAVIGPAAYSDAAGANRVTTALIAAGADIIFGQGDGASFGMLEAIETNEAADGGKVLFIDVIGNKSSIDDGGHLLSSVLWDFSGAFERMITDIGAGTFGNTNYDLGLADGSVDLLQTDLIPADLWAEVQDLKQQILGGSVVVENIADADGVHARMSSVDVAEG